MYEKCRFCQTFWEISKKKWKATTRLCPITKRDISQDDGCDKLVIASFIRCDRLLRQIPTKACINRQKIKEKVCKKCEQGRQLLWLLREKNPPKPIVKKGGKINGKN